MYSARDNAALPALGLPIRESTGHRLFNASPWLFAVVHALLRLLMPRHPPYTLYILTVICSVEASSCRRTGCLRRPRSGENHLHGLKGKSLLSRQLCSFQGPARGSRGDSAAGLSKLSSAA